MVDGAVYDAVTLSTGATVPRGPQGGIRARFLVPQVEILRTDGPNPLTSHAYAKDFNEVKEVGSLRSATRTADQTEAAIFCQDHGPAVWNRVFRALAASRGLDVAEEVINARVWAGIHFRTADEQGAALGAKVARWEQHNYFQPLH